MIECVPLTRPLLCWKLQCAAARLPQPDRAHFHAFAPPAFAEAADLVHKKLRAAVFDAYRWPADRHFQRRSTRSSSGP